MEIIVGLDLDVMNVVVGSLTGTQLMQGLNIYNTLTKDLGGSDATTAIIGKLTTVLMNNLSPFMNQAIKFVIKINLFCS